MEFEIHKKINIIAIWIIIGFLLFIFQIAILGLKPYNSEPFLSTIKNWKKKPILDILEEDNGNHLEEITFYGKKLYLQRMDKKFNYPYLMKRSEKFKDEGKKGGKDSNRNTIYFPKYEPCPIN